MKPSIKPTNNEYLLADNDFIISKTDVKGRLTYVNRIFMNIAGYRESELLGVQHNVIRHPDMPRGAFRFLWNTLKQGDEFFAFVKNLCANGDYYWVFANVTPDLDKNGKVKGYYSVRRKASKQAVEIISAIYKDMLAIEKKVGLKSGPDESVAHLIRLLAEQKTTYQDFVLDLYHNN